MAILGAFTPIKNGFAGAIDCLTSSAPDVRIVLVTKPNELAPDYRVYRGTAEVGAAWAKTAKSGRAFLVVTLDDPAFAAPIRCRLVPAGKIYNLVWTR